MKPTTPAKQHEIVHSFWNRFQLVPLLLSLGVTLMDITEEFRRHADMCRHMARSVPDQESKGSWNLLAERWSRCAELAATRKSKTRPRRVVYKNRREPTLTDQHAS